MVVPLQWQQTVEICSAGWVFRVHWHGVHGQWPTAGHLQSEYKAITQNLRAWLSHPSRVNKAPCAHQLLLTLLYVVKKKTQQLYWSLKDITKLSAIYKLTASMVRFSGRPSDMKPVKIDHFCPTAEQIPGQECPKNICIN